MPLVRSSKDSVETLSSLHKSWGQPADLENDEVPSGVENLVSAMTERVFPYTTHEAKELFRKYIKQSGALARQSGESMTQHIRFIARKSFINGIVDSVCSARYYATRLLFQERTQ